MTQAATRRIAASTRKPLASFGLRVVGQPSAGTLGGAERERIKGDDR
jgi:hypothetical protein